MDALVGEGLQAGGRQGFLGLALGLGVARTPARPRGLERRTKPTLPLAAANGIIQNPDIEAAMRTVNRKDYSEEPGVSPALSALLLWDGRVQGGVGALCGVSPDQPECLLPPVSLAVGFRGLPAPHRLWGDYQRAAHACPLPGDPGTQALPGCQGGRGHGWVKEAGLDWRFGAVYTRVGCAQTPGHEPSSHGWLQVLDCGSGSGYLTAVFAHLVTRGGAQGG